MTSLSATFILLLAVTLFSTVLCSCTCSTKSINFEYIRRYGNRLTSNLLHPHVCEVAVDPILNYNDPASMDETCCCRGLWRRPRLMLDDGQTYMTTAYYCHQVPCPS